MKKFFSKKLAVVGLGSLVIGAVATGGVFAAIPNSTNGLITGCRNNNTSALKVIDAQSGATCSANETMLSWWSASATSTGPAPKTAIFHLTSDSSDPDFNYVYDPALSRGIVAVKKLVANDPVNNPTDNRLYCVDLGFTIRYSSSTETANYEAINPGVQSLIDEVCGGLEFDVILSANSYERAIFFTE